VFDALRFTLIEDEPKTDSMDETPGGGCSTGRGQAGALALVGLAGLTMVSRRRRVRCC
jgi:MYXO-CTERM domain-containing protein